MCVELQQSERVEDLRTALRILWEEQLSVLKDTFSEAQNILTGTIFAFLDGFGVLRVCQCTKIEYQTCFFKLLNVFELSHMSYAVVLTVPGAE